MLRLFIIMAIVVLVVMFIQQLKAHLARDRKRQELDEAKLDGELIDMDKEIAEEKSRQKDVAEEIEKIQSELGAEQAEHEASETKKDSNND